MEIKTFARGAVAALALSAISLTAAPAIAGEVSLSAYDGSAIIIGELVSFEDEIYIIETILGDLVIYVEDVSCEGVSCPILTNAGDIANS